MIYLASQSPRRRELLQQIGVDHQVVHVTVDESHFPGESAEAYVERIARRKAEAGRQICPDHPVLGADTMVLLGNRLLGKPNSRAEGIETLLALSGQHHRVLTGVALVGAEDAYLLSESRVKFRHISQQEAQAYWRSGEPADKAGCYGIQGLGAIFIERIEGSYSGIMGLPLYETAQLLQQAGIKVLADS